MATVHRVVKREAVPLQLNRLIEKGNKSTMRNELADKLAKEATRDSEICYNKIPKSEIEHQDAISHIYKPKVRWKLI